MKYFVLAEKPSVGKEIAKLLGCYENHKGYKEGPNAIISWALGHLGSLCNPDYYDPNLRRWTLESLPFLPPKLDIEPLEETKEQLQIIKDILKRDDISYVVIATDAGREGELVARWILQLCSYKGEAKRLWVSSQTEAALKEAFAKLKDASEYDSLFDSAFARSAADWYVGLNVTRALTCKYDMKLSAGRVQTPTLALITKREEEIEAFKSAYYYTIKAVVNGDNFIYSEKLDKEEDAKKVYDSLNESKQLVVKTRDISLVVDKPPLAYDLNELQRDANTFLDFSAKKTLDVLQGLYENHKIVTYPRTDSRYITADILPTLDQRLAAIMNTPLKDEILFLAKSKIREDLSHFVNDEKVSDHHAIIPTEQVVRLDRLNNDEKALWSLIATRFIEVLSSDYEYESISISANDKDYIYNFSTTNTKNPGYRRVGLVYNFRRETKMVNLDYYIDDDLKVDEVKLDQKAKAGPEYYTEASLLGAMENAGRLVDDKELKKYLGKGLGTPATRADIIEKLLNNNYIRRDAKFLRATSKGRELIKLCPPDLSSAELTGEWETELDLIGKKKINKEEFIDKIKNYTKKLIKDVKLSNIKYEPNYEKSKDCPFCKSKMMGLFNHRDNTLHYICQKLSCSYEERLVEKPVAKIEKDLKIGASLDYNKMLEEALAGEKKPAKKIVVKASPKKPVVIKKKSTSIKAPEFIIEVVKESKYRPRTNYNRDNKDYKSREANQNRSSKSNSSSGGTFADFINASKERNKRRDDSKKS